MCGIAYILEVTHHQMPLESHLVSNVYVFPLFHIDEINNTICSQFFIDITSQSFQMFW